MVGRSATPAMPKPKKNKLRNTGLAETSKTILAKDKSGNVIGGAMIRYLPENVNPLKYIHERMDELTQSGYSARAMPLYNFENNVTAYIISFGREDYQHA